jgi:transcriptional regulator with XRE-family HTH domain
MAVQESLGEFITRILNEKKLSLSDVERRTQRAISDSYLSYIMKDKGRNLTLRKLKALALGLGVSEVMILKAACGIPLIDATESPGGEFAHVMYQYDQLSDLDKTDLKPVLQLLCREIERRLSSPENEHSAKHDPASS